MDAKTLRRLADAGLLDLPIGELPTLSAWCWDWSEVGGDARFASVARALEPLQELIEEADERGGTSTALLERVDRHIRERLSDVLDADTPVDGSIAARGFREELAVGVDGSRPAHPGARTYRYHRLSDAV